MPYKIIKQDKKYLVVKLDDNQVMGEHDTRIDAQTQIAALYANETAKHLKIGQRNAATDLEMIQAIHNLACRLGATCEQEEAEEESEDEGKGLNLDYVKSLHLSNEIDLSVKRIGTDEIQSYLALFGDPNTVDLEREFFTTYTDTWDATLGLPRPLTYDHGQDANTKSAPVIGKITEIGRDDFGIWYRAQLDKSHKYRKVIDKLIDAGALGTSSDSAPQYVIREKSKSGAVWLKQWPIFAASLTPTPCEPRMIGKIEWLKSFGVDLDALPDASPDVTRHMLKNLDVERLRLELYKLL